MGLPLAMPADSGSAVAALHRADASVADNTLRGSEGTGADGEEGGPSAEGASSSKKARVD